MNKLIHFLEDQLDEYWDRIPTQREIIESKAHIDKSSYNLGVFHAFESILNKIEEDE